MSALFSYLRAFHFGSVLFRLILAMTASGIIGYGRTRRSKTAGLWTSGLIGLTIGAGFYEGAILGIAMIVLVETCFNGIRNKYNTLRNLRRR